MRRMPVALAALAMAFAGAAAASPSKRPPHLGVYYATWAAEAGPSSLDGRLSGVPAGVTEVFLAFLRPDATYYGNLDLLGTGVEVGYSGQVLKASLAALRARIPGIRILASVGGAEYANWKAFDPRAIRRFVEDFELDGVDLDFEPAAPNCRTAMERIVCDSDGLLLDVVTAARATLPRPIVVWLTATNTGAYGAGRWAQAGPVGGPTYGAFLPLLRDRPHLAQIDGLSIMAYDAGPTYRPLDAYAAYRSHFDGPILIGFTSPPEAWGGHVYTVRKTVETFQSAMREGANGAMIFAIGKEPPANPSPERPGPDDLITALIQIVGRGDSP